jgi:Uma2 family endonuclease
VFDDDGIVVVMLTVRAKLRDVTRSRGPRRRATYDDILSAPEHLVAELIDGELFTSPRPASPHALAASSLGGELMLPFQRGRGGPGGWWILDEPELHFGADVLVPDIAGWRQERMPEIPRAPFFTLVPDWVCEVLSPSTERLDREIKLRIYAREGVEHAWLVDPIAKRLEVLHRKRSRWAVRATHHDDDRVRAAPFDAIELELAYLWSGLAAPEARPVTEN